MTGGIAGLGVLRPTPLGGCAKALPHITSTPIKETNPKKFDFVTSVPPKREIKRNSAKIS
jgi:hypothetical protein